MIRYLEQANAWVSAKNPDDQGMPSTDLTGDLNICCCIDCNHAYDNKLGTNWDKLPH